MKNYSLFKIIFFFLSVVLYGQSIIKSDSLSCTVESVINKKDTIDFVIAKKDNQKKKTIIFLQGNGAIPLFFKENGKLSFALPFSVQNYLDDYNFVFISKPAIPLIGEDLFEGYLYAKHGIPPPKYTENNDVESQSRRVEKVIDYLCKQEYVDKNNLFLFGHSQGARNAAYLLKNKKIKGTVIASINLYGRFDEFINQLRFKALSEGNDIEIYKEILSEYEDYGKLMKNQDSTRKWDRDTYKTWASNTFPRTIDYLLKTKKPVLVIYGSEDLSSVFSDDTAMLDFIRNGKTNISVHCFQNIDHVFMTKDFTSHWKEVFEYVFQWIDKIPNNLNKILHETKKN